MWIRFSATIQFCLILDAFLLPKEKLSPSPVRGGGLTTAIANGHSSGTEPARADRS